MSPAQLALFEVARVAPSRGEHRAAVAAARRQAAEGRKQANALKRWRREEARQERERAQPAATCCGYWYPAGSGWTHCHKCRKALRAPVASGVEP